MGMKCGVKPNYTPVEYIEGTGTQYIDVGYKNSAFIHIVMQISYSDQSANNLCGSEASSSARYKWGTNGNSYLYIGYGSSNLTADVKPTIGEKYTYEIKNGLQKVTDSNGTNIISSQVTSLTTYNTYNITLFKQMGSGGSVGGAGKMRIHYCKIYRGSVLIANLIPVIDENNEACMYDTVFNVFRRNVGTGTFLSGNPTTPSIEDGTARHIPQAYCSVNNTARKILKGYCSVNGVATRFYLHVPYGWVTGANTGITRNYVGQGFGIAKTINYVVLFGGRSKSSSGSMNTSYSEAFNADGVITTTANKTISHCGGMTINGNAVFVGGHTSTSSSSLSNSVTSYNDNLIQTALSNLASTAYGMQVASNSVHGMRLGGNAYSGVRNNAESYNNELVKSTTTNLSSARKNNGVAAVGNYIITCAGSTSSSSSGGTISTAEAYDNNNVKTSAPSISQAANWKKGISTSKYAIFYGGTTTNENGVPTNIFAYYDSNLVKSELTYPYKSYNGVGLQVDDILVIGSGDVRTSAGGTVTYPSNVLFYTTDLVRIDEVAGGSDADFQQDRYQMIARNRVYYATYQNDVGYLKY